VEEPATTPSDDALLTVLEQHGDQMFFLLKRITHSDIAAEDLLQDLFLRLRQSAAFARADDPAAYARRVALNLGLDWLRRRDERCIPFTGSPTADDRAPWEDLSRQEEEQRVLQALATLPRTSREIIASHFLAEESYEQIAERLHKTPHQVRALCHKGIKKMRRALSAPTKRAAPGKGELT